MTSLVSELKGEKAGMFHNMEISAVRADMAHLLVRIKDTEQRQDSQEVAIKELQETDTQLAYANWAS